MKNIAILTSPAIFGSISVTSFFAGAPVYLSFFGALLGAIGAVISLILVIKKRRDHDKSMTLIMKSLVELNALAQIKKSQTEKSDS